ncbi:cysteine-rich CWC family protein, partial [Pseudomonas aeruginosa]
CFPTDIVAAALERIPAALRRRACLCPRCAQLLPPDADD